MRRSLFGRSVPESSSPRVANTHPRLVNTPAVPPAELSVDAVKLSSSWVGEKGRLVLSADAPATSGQRAVVSVIGVAGAALTVSGEVVGARSADAGFVLEVEPDEEGRALVARILGFLEGGGERPRARAPRHRLTLPAVVSTHSGSTYMTTFSVSRGGCGLAWSGPAPRLGDMLWVRLGSGVGAAALRGMVCWARDDGNGQRVGIRFVGGKDAELSTLLAKARREAAGG
jgi:hypothetical protein